MHGNSQTLSQVRRLVLFFFQEFVSRTQVHMPTEKNTQLPNLSLQSKIK